MEETPSERSQIEWIRHRPAMYIGDLGSVGISHLFYNCIFVCHTLGKCRPAKYVLSIKSDLAFVLSIGGNIFDDEVIRTMPNLHYEYYDLIALVALCDKLKIEMPRRTVEFEKGVVVKDEVKDAPGLLFSGVLDKTIFLREGFDYEQLRDYMRQLAMLNKSFEILINDTRAKYLRQDWFHLPSGVRNLFEQKVEKDRREFIELEAEINGNDYYVLFSIAGIKQVAPCIMSFAGIKKTDRHGSLVDGILQAFVAATRAFVGVHSPGEYFFRKSSVLHSESLFLFASVKHHGCNMQRFDYAGATRQKLNEPHIKKDIAAACFPLFLNAMNGSPKPFGERAAGMFYNFNFIEDD